MKFKSSFQQFSHTLLHMKKSHWLDSILSLTFPFEMSLAANDVWAIVFICCISLFIPPFAALIPIYVLMKTTRRIAREKELERPGDLEQLILYIQMNHLQSLTEALEADPVLLHCVYKKKSLLSWCKTYNNTKALMVVIQMCKKYPKEKFAMAA